MRCLRWVLGLAGVLLVGTGVVGQDDPVFELTVESVGVGGLAREGDWVGIEVRFRDPSDEPREVLLELRGTDADGDTPLYRRAVASNPGRDQRAWLYAYLPHGSGGPSPLVLNACEALEAPGTPGGYTAGATLARAPVSMDDVLSAETGILLAVGRTPGGIRQYNERDPAGNRPWRERGHGLVEIAGELSPSDLPDRWTGLAGVEVMLWTDAPPGLLSERRAEALRRWIERGGHLVVAPGSRTDEWLFGESAISRLTRGLRTEGSRPRDVSSLLTANSVDPPPGGFAVSGFVAEPAATPGSSADRAEYQPILTDRAGLPVVVRARVGHGAVTLVGIDLASPRLADRDRPHARSFWTRVLGWREGVERAATNDGGPAIIGGRRQAILDESIRSEVGMSGAAALGVLVGLFTFLGYFAAAGPLAFFVLKRMSKTRFAWTAYLVAGMAFTGIAWGAATALRPTEPLVRHVSYLDLIDGEPAARVRSWASVLLPAYGQGAVRLGGEEGAGIITAWQGPGLGDGLVGRAFPDARPYGVDGRGPAEISVPARSTVKQVRADWLGVSSEWGGFEAVGAGGLGGGEIRVDPSTNRISGRLRHLLPVALTDVTVVVNRGQRPVSNVSGDRPVFNASVYRLTGRFETWDAGQELDLAELAGSIRLADATADAYFRELTRRTDFSSIELDDLVSYDRGEALTAAGWTSQFDPPSRSGDVSNSVVALRRETFGLDLARWFTRPCVIVVAQAVDGEGDSVPAPAPFEVSLNSGAPSRPVSAGRTIVRWVYPLPPAAPRWSAE
ncbi:MAG: hypothetical protein AAF108_05870 [Planctomycetota bacterium]